MITFKEFANGTTHFKKIIWEGELIDLEQFVLIDEAIKPRFTFGMNHPTFDDGKMHSKGGTVTFTKIEDYLFMIHFSTDHEVQFAIVKEPQASDTPIDLYRKADIRLNARVPYTELVKLFSVVLGSIVQYIETNKPRLVAFTALDSRLASLYDKMLESKSVQSMLNHIGFQSAKVRGVYVIRHK